MGKFLDKFKKAGEVGKNVGVKAGQRIDRFANQQTNRQQRFNTGKIRDKNVNPNAGMTNFDDFNDFGNDLGYDPMGLGDNQSPYELNVRTPQKPASFHHFLLENKYRDLEMDIRGYKEVFNKDEQKWEIKRKGEHCFTDEEAEEILGMVQSHLSTDIKLTFYSKETFGIRFLAVMEAVSFKFERIMEYQFGRFGDSTRQGEMKAKALQILISVITRIEANYLMAIQGIENKRTHEGIQSQESLQGNGMNDNFGMNRRYS